MGRFQKAQDVLGKLALVACLVLLLISLGFATLRLFERKSTNLETTPRQVETDTRPLQQSGLNLNTATKEDLMSLPGIGEKLAEQVLAQRAINPFYFVEDLRMVPGFGDKRIEALKELVYVIPPE